MVWVNPPPTVLQLRNQLLICPTFSTAPWSLTAASFHYPTANPTQGNSNLPAPDMMPLIVLADMDTERERYAEGAVGLINGELVAMIYVSAENTQLYGAGLCETYARQVLIDMGNQYFGLNFKKMGVRLSADPKPGQQGDTSSSSQALYRTISLHFTYGLSRSR